MRGRTAGRAAVTGLLLALVLPACGTPGTAAAPPLPVRSAPTESADAGSSAPAEPGAVNVPPVSVKLTAAGAAPVGLADVTEDGALDVPPEVSELGWWVGSSPMGATAGTTLIAGHVDSALAGLGYFSKLTELEQGDEITVTDGVGKEHVFAVSETQQVTKSELPQDLFDTTGERRLALITCGGEFDEKRRSYTDNYIVFATPV